MYVDLDAVPPRSDDLRKHPSCTLTTEPSLCAAAVQALVLTAFSLPLLLMLRSMVLAMTPTPSPLAHEAALWVRPELAWAVGTLGFWLMVFWLWELWRPRES